MAFSARSLLVKLHRYAGIATACFLFQSGITGSLIAFWPELDVALNPDLYWTARKGEALSASTLAAKVETADPRALAVWVPLRLAPGEAAGIFVHSRENPANETALGYNQVFVDPVSGDIIGRRQWGGCCFDRQHLMPFLHTFHYTL